MTDDELTTIVQNHTGFPWFNGTAYAEYKGYPGEIKTLRRAIARDVDELADVMEWLRGDKHFAQADRLRTIIGRLARCVPPVVHETPDWIIAIARGWK